MTRQTTLSIQFAIPLILSSLICLSGIDLAIFTFQTMMDRLKDPVQVNMDGYAEGDNPTTEPSVSDTSLTPQTDFRVAIPEPVYQIHSPKHL